MSCGPTKHRTGRIGCTGLSVRVSIVTVLGGRCPLSPFGYATGRYWSRQFGADKVSFCQKQLVNAVSWWSYVILFVAVRFSETHALQLCCWRLANVTVATWLCVEPPAAADIRLSRRIFVSRISAEKNTASRNLFACFCICIICSLKIIICLVGDGGNCQLSDCTGANR